MWKSINTPPKEDGLYVVAEFDSDVMVSFDTNWAKAESYWGPNNIGYQERIHATHWMSHKEYRALLENTPRI